ncbi:MAG: phenylalanine--tRNA ligase subunit beta, partial [Acidobacteriota bacterium]|nr:phenylalanine--tRNA ligase subunit beta [Acidobacteriota bacterium]
KLPGGRIVVRRGKAGERLTTLDGVERKMDEKSLVIAGVEGAIALAGIMGGSETEVGEGTNRVLIESACFAPQLVRRTARRLGLHTDASHRFERGSDPEACLEAALRAAELMADLGGGEVEAVVVDAQPGPITKARGCLDLEGLEQFAGVAVPRDLVENGLGALGFELAEQHTGIWEVTVPSWRRLDFELDERGEVYPAYFYEEALRLFGFDRIPSTVPAVRGPDSGSSRGHRVREGLREYLSAAGFAETVTYPFQSAAADSWFPGLERAAEPLVLANALSELYEVMRRSLLPGLVEGARFNQRRQASAVQLFEIGHLFPGGETAEIEALGVVMGGEFDRPWERRTGFDLFDLKGVAEGLGARAGIEFEFRRAECRGLLSGTASEILVSDRPERVGYLGQVEDSNLAFPLFALELAASAVARSQPPRVDPPSRFPGVDVDLTLTHGVDLAWSKIHEAIRADPPAELVDFGLKDRYQGEEVPAGAVNSTIFFRYVSNERSLTQEEVNERHLRLAVRLDERFGWRGDTS